MGRLSDRNRPKAKLKDVSVRRILFLFKRYWGQLLVIIGLALLAAVIGLVPPLVMKEIIDTAIPQGRVQLLGAVGEEVVDLDALGLGQLAVEVGAQKLERVGGRQRGHPSIVLSCARPRWMRLRTVPTGTSSDSAISW